MKCQHCGHKVENIDYQVPQTTVYPDINKCYPCSNGYTTMFGPNASVCSSSNPTFIDLTSLPKATLTILEL